MILMYWKLAAIVAIAASVAGLGYMGYNKVKDIGYHEAKVEYDQKIKDYNDKLDVRIASIEQNSSMLADTANQLKEQSASEFKAIMAATKGRPLYTIKAGVCSVSDDFIKAYNDAVSKANRK